MDGVTLWVAGAIGSGLIGVVLAVAFDEPIRGLLGLVFNRRARVDPLAGRWRAEFQLPDGSAYVEVILVKKRLGRVKGYIVPHRDNHPALREVEASRPLRVQGSLSTSDVFSGRWYHPLETARFHGTFQLLMNAHGDRLSGRWLGFSETRSEILSGPWEWRRLGA